MTFQESEYPDLIETVMALAQKGVFSADDLLKIMWQLHQRVPVYPGIVKMCLEKARENPAPGDLHPDDLIAIEKDGEKIIGYVEKISDRQVILRDGYTRKKFSRREVVIEPDNRVERLRQDSLERTWPTLVFEEKNGEKVNSAKSGGGK